MERKTLKDLRILIVGGKPHAVATLRMAFGIVGFANVEAVAKSARAVEILSSRSVDAVFCDECAAPLDGVPFPQAARRIKGVLDPMVPIFLICDAPKRRHVERARDVGVTNVLVRPISAATVVRKLRLAMAAPRPFILAGDFFGPDRRGASRPAFSGADRRRRAPRKLAISPSDAAALLGGKDPGDLAPAE